MRIIRLIVSGQWRFLAALAWDRLEQSQEAMATTEIESIADEHFDGIRESREDMEARLGDLRDVITKGNP